MIRTGYVDRLGQEIKMGDTVSLDGAIFEIDVNIFNDEIVVDGETGMEKLSLVHDQCVIVGSKPLVQ